MEFVNEDLIVKRRTDLEEVKLKHFGWMCVLLSQRDRFYLEVFIGHRHQLRNHICAWNKTSKKPL